MNNHGEFLLKEENGICDSQIEIDRRLMVAHECVFKKCCKKYKKKGKKHCKSCPKR